MQRKHLSLSTILGIIVPLIPQQFIAWRKELDSSPEFLFPEWLLQNIAPFLILHRVEEKQILSSSIHNVLPIKIFLSTLRKTQPAFPASTNESVERQPCDGHPRDQNSGTFKEHRGQTKSRTLFREFRFSIYHWGKSRLHGGARFNGAPFKVRCGFRFESSAFPARSRGCSPRRLLIASVCTAG